MSGLGRKVFTAGEVLTAANVQDFLQDQAVMVFSGTAARGSALPGTVVSEGMVTYQLDSNTITVYDGSVWQQVYPVSSFGGTITASQVSGILPGSQVGTISGTQVAFGGTATTTSMTATAALDNGTIWVNGTAAVTITVPDVLQTWDTLTIWRNAGGTVTIAAGTGVTDWAGGGTAGTAVTFKIDQTYNAATVQKVAANTYRVVGKITV
jgi:hypothetical protein